MVGSGRRGGGCRLITLGLCGHELQLWIKQFGKGELVMTGAAIENEILEGVEEGSK